MVLESSDTLISAYIPEPDGAIGASGQANLSLLVKLNLSDRFGMLL